MNNADPSQNVTVVIPFYNDSITIDRALESVRRQSLPPHEVIIIDDGSRPNEAKRLESIVSCGVLAPIRLVTLPRNAGPSTARNTGWELAEGDYVAFLDADDSWHPLKLEMQLSVFKRVADVGLVGTRAGLGRVSEGRLSNCRLLRVSPLMQLLQNRFVTSSVMLRRSIELRFSTDMRYSEDNDLWCRILLNGVKAMNVDAELTRYYKSPRSRSGASGRFLKMLQGQLGVYASLHDQRSISTLVFLMCCTSAMARFFRRMVLVLVDDVTGSPMADRLTSRNK